MESGTDSMAWLARRDGRVTLGHGPFENRASAPEDGVAFYVQDFALSDSLPWKIPSRTEHLSVGDFVDRFPPAEGPGCAWDTLDAAPFSSVFQEVMTAIHEGIFEKTVPVVTETGRAAKPPGPDIIAAMARCAAPLQSYGWVRSGSGFAGATPELLLSMDGHRLETMALAGTARIEDKEVFAVDEKEIREHQYVAQTLVSKLHDLGKLDRQPRKILDLGSIVHFLTPITVDLNERMSPDALIRRLHPTPALGPLPRTDVSMELLLDWRKRLGCPEGFGAPFGLWENGSFEAIVAIRGVWWDGLNVRMPAGCGVIEASRLVNEWRELRLKREAIRELMAFPTSH